MRKQIAFASLTPAELEQVGEWLVRETYEVVLERVCKSRSEGGFALDISRSPLERLYDKKTKLDLVNSRIASGQRLTLSEFIDIEAGEKRAKTEKIHDAILDATYDLVKSGENTPAQLLSLQRLADFPERVELREERRELDRRKEDRAVQMHALRVETAEHRKQLALERLELAKKSLALREKRDEERRAEKAEKAEKTKPNTQPVFQEPPGFLPRSERPWSDVSERVRLRHGLSKEDWAHRIYDEPPVTGSPTCVLNSPSIPNSQFAQSPPSSSALSAGSAPSA